MALLQVPDTALSLLLAGVLLLYVEINRPGLILPGAAGLILTLLSLHSLASFPIHLGAIALIVLAIPLTLFAASRSHALTLPSLLSVAMLGGGLANLTPTHHPTPILILTSAFALITLLLARAAHRARANKYSLGLAETLGKEATTQTALTPSGKIAYNHQLYPATLADAQSTLPAQSRVLVRSIQGQSLLVDPAAE